MFNLLFVALIFRCFYWARGKPEKLKIENVKLKIVVSFKLPFWLSALISKLQDIV